MEMSLNHGTSARGRAIRALAEGAPASLALLADASGRTVEALLRQAKREGWVVGGDAWEDSRARLRPIVASLLDKLEALGQAAAEGGGIDRTEVEGVVSLVKLIERVVEITRPEEAANEKKNTRDEDLAAVLQRINDRIIALAGELAGQMVAERDRLPGRGTAGGLLGDDGAAEAVSGRPGADRQLAGAGRPRLGQDAAGR
jgi:hypothetical protein